MSSFRPGSRISSVSCAEWSTCTSAARCACWCGATRITASTPAWCTCRATVTTPRCASASSRSRSPASPAPAWRVTRRSPARATRACTSWYAPARVGAYHDVQARTTTCRRAWLEPEIERRIAEAALTWADRLRELLTERRGEAEGLALASRYGHAFPLAYQEDVAPGEVLADLADLEALRPQPNALQLNLHRPAGQTPQRVHLKIVKLGDPVPISDVLPMLENFGLRVISERPYELAWPEGGAAWIQDFELEQRDGLIV